MFVTQFLSNFFFFYLFNYLYICYPCSEIWFPGINLNKRKEQQYQKEPIFPEIYKFHFQLSLVFEKKRRKIYFYRILFSFLTSCWKTLFIKNIIFFHFQHNLQEDTYPLSSRDSHPAIQQSFFTRQDLWNGMEWNLMEWASDWMSKWMITCNYKSNYEW